MKISRRLFFRNAGAGALLFSQLAQGGRPTTAREPLRLGLIGAGARGSWLARIAATLPELEVVACCDLLPDNNQACGELVGRPIAYYDDYRNLLADNSIQAVLIATPLFLHFDMAKTALQAGKHVYCEKAMVHTRKQAEDLKRMAGDSSAPVFQVGYQHRFNPLYTEVKFLIDQGYCGKIVRVECTWNRNGNWRRTLPLRTTFKGNADFPDLEHLLNWRMYRRYSGGLVAELCSHQMDILHWLLDDRPEWITGTGGVDYWNDGRETYDNVHLLVHYSKGVNVTFTSLTSNALQGYSIRILGDRGSVEITGEDGHRARIFAEHSESEQPVDGVTAATKLAWENSLGVPVRVKNPARDDTMPTEGALRHFAHCVREGSVPVSNVDSAYVSSVMVCLANEAIATGRRVYWE